MKKNNSVCFTDFELYYFLLKLNDMGALNSYMNVTNDEISEIFHQYLTIVENKNGQSFDPDVLHAIYKQDDENYDYSDEAYVQKCKEYSASLLTYKNMIEALLMIDRVMPEPSEKEIHLLESFILSDDSQFEDFEEPSEEEIECMKLIFNTDQETNLVYPTEELNLISYAWKSGMLNMIENDLWHKKNKRLLLETRTLLFIIWGALSVIHYKNQQYLNILGDVSTCVLFNIILSINKKEQDEVLKYEKISYIYKWLMSSGLLTGLSQNQITMPSIVLVSMYYIASKLTGWYAENEKIKRIK